MRSVSTFEERFNKSLNSIIDRFTKNIKRIYYALIFQVLFFLVVISLTTFTSINQEQILWVASIIGIAGIGVVADLAHLKKTLKDGFNDLKILRKFKDTLVSIPEILDTYQDDDERAEEMRKYATFLRTILKKVILTGNPESLMPEVTNILKD